MKKNVFLLAVAIILSSQLLTAQNFNTQWNLATAGSGATQLTIRTATSGTANYTWQQLPSGASGSGSWSGISLTITGLPAGATIRLQIAPANFQQIIINYDADRNRLTQVEQWGSTAWTSMANAFQGCTNLQVTATDVPVLSGVNSLQQMFEGCTNLNSPANINTWNIGAVTNLSYMFAFTSAFNQNISSWNTAAVTNLQGMFFQASAFNQNIGSWNTAAVTNMSLMFYQASSFNQNIGSWNTAAVTNMESMFNRASAFNNGGSNSINNWNTAAVTNMSYMFSQASAFNQNIGSWNTAAVTNMQQMFQQASAFNQNISSWNTAAVTDMNYMFREATAFNQNIGSWVTTAVTNMSYMFSGATAFNQNIGSWNTAAVTDVSGMFSQASSFDNGGNNSINSWNTGSVTNMSFMFSGASVFNRNVGSWNTAAVTNMQQLFQEASAFNQNIGAWNTTAVNNMRLMFNSAGAFNQNIGAWNTAGVTDMFGMFSGASVFNRNIGSWNTAAVTDMTFMLSQASVFNQNIGTWTLNPVVDLSNMLDNSGLDCGNYSATLIGWSANPSTPDNRNLGAAGLQYGTNAVAARTNLTGAKGWAITGDAPSGFSCVPLNSNDFVTVWNLGLVGAPNTQITFGVATSGTVNYTWETIPGAASGSGTFTGSTATITGFPAFAEIRLSIQPANFQRINMNFGTDRTGLVRVENWGSTAWTSMETAFSGCNNLQITATDVPDLSGVTDMSRMFQGCTDLNSPGNINNWNMAAVTNMALVFSGASVFNQNIDSWNTAAVTNMSSMFYQASAFNQNIGSWNTAAVTDMSSMFYQASAFNQNIGPWNTAAVTNKSLMFFEALAFNQNIGSWNTAAVTNMAFMFSQASAFNQNIGAWNTAAVTNMFGMFAGASTFNNGGNNSINNWNTGAVTNMIEMFAGASAFNQNIGLWNTTAVTSMSFMFAGATAFNQNIGSWTLNSAVNLSNMLDGSGINCNNYSGTLTGWNANPLTPNGRSLGATGRQYGSNAVAARTNLTGAKGWTITGDAPSGSSCSVILPVTWLYVNGQLQNGNAIIKWATASETNTNRFEVEHSSNGINYSKISTVTAAGNSSSTLRYEYLHTSPVLGKNYYRIKQIDLDGRFTYSSIILLRKTEARSNTIISPNPVQIITTLFFSTTSRKTIELLTINGTILLSEQINGANSSYQLNMSKFLPGIYLLRIQTENSMETHKVIKQ